MFINSMTAGCAAASSCVVVHSLRRSLLLPHLGKMWSPVLCVALVLLRASGGACAYGGGATYSPSTANGDSAIPRGLFPMYQNYSLAGVGSCGPPRQRGEYFDVRCVGPEQKLKPGQVSNVLAILPSPYPKHGLVEVINQTTQVINSAGAPVPLSEIYMHHYVGATTLLVEGGAELRGRKSRLPLEEPYSWVVDGAEFYGNNKSRVVNIYLISTAGVGPDDIGRCLQCPCDDNPDRGGFACCKDCTTQTPGPPRSYWFEYNVTYRKLGARDIRAIKPIDLMWYDVTGFEEGIEYQILDTTNQTHIKTYETEVDGGCEQEHDFEIVRCSGHQHIGSRCITLFNAENGEQICKSCPVYGTVEGEPGNEAGYVVKMTDEVLSPPYKIAPGTRVRLESAYLGTERRTGVMGLIHTWVAGLSTPCYREYGYYHYHHYFRPSIHNKQQLGSW